MSKIIDGKLYVNGEQCCYRCGMAKQSAEIREGWKCSGWGVVHLSHLWTIRDISPKAKRPYKIKPTRIRIMTRVEYDKLKAGSVIVSKAGNERRVIKKSKGSEMIKLRKLGRVRDYTLYCYNDICTNYTVLKF